MEKVLRIGIAHRFKLLNESLSHALNSQAGLCVVGTASSGQQVLDLVKNVPVDMLLLDPFFEDKDCLDMIKQVLASDKQVHLIVMLMENLWRLANRFLHLGVKGFILSQCGLEEMVAAIRQVAGGSVYLPTNLSREIFEKWDGRTDSLPAEKLTDREFQVMVLLAAGKTKDETAKTLFIGPKTVDTHRANLLRKLGLRNNVELSLFATQHGFIRGPANLF